ncbi:MAG: hypothetical protein IKZ87_01840 [Actinomycetaceae bacterium]|nr:hypothetical protein [Actinomycetaceae bacterium]
MAKEKKRSFGRKLFKTALLAGVGVVGYLVYSNLKPVEDPWAAAYWEDVPAKA